MKVFVKMTMTDFKRTLLRNPAALIASLLMPIGFYLLFTKVMNQNLPAQALRSFQKQYMVSMIIYSMVTMMFFSLPSLLAMDRQVGIPTWLRITKLPKITYYAAKLINLLLQNAVSILAVYLVARLVNQVQLTLREFLFMLIWLLLASLPLTLVGVMIAMLENENTRDMIANLIAFPLVIVSGLWWPIDQMPKLIQGIGHLSPVYALNQGGQALAGAKNLSFSWIMILVIAFLLLLAVNLCLNKLKNRFNLALDD